MDKEKVIEIKEALKLNEYFAIEYLSKSGESKIFTFTDILTLINDLESENAYKQEHIELWFKKNEEKKARIAELETKNEVLCVELSRYTEHCVEMKNGTLKQFAERLKIESVNKIHETLKEFINV